MKNKEEILNFYNEYLNQNLNLKKYCSFKNVNYKVVQYSFKKLYLKVDKSKNFFLDLENRNKLTKDLLSERLSSKELRIKYNITEDILLSHIKRNNITCKFLRKGKLIKDSNFFFNIDSELKAYILGFFYADGNVSKKYNRVSLGVQIIDDYILNHLLDNIGGSIRSQKSDLYKEMYYWNANSVILKKDLISLGCLPNKSRDGMKFPNISKDLIRHFIRGFFDGDGCITTNTKTTRISFYNTSKPFLEEIAKFINFDKARWYTPKNKKNPCYSLSFGDPKVRIKIKELFYNNSSIYLTRKKNKFDNMINTE